MAKPAVLFGGPSPEHDVSVLTGLQAARALGDVTGVYWAKDGRFWEVDADLEAGAFADGVPRKAGQLRLQAGEGLLGKRRPLELSAVVNCCHGGPGEDGTLQAALDLAGVAYTGPTMAGAALGMDKLAFGNVVAGAGLPSLPRAALTPDAGAAVAWEGPTIVKPRFGGSSIGIEVVEDMATARLRLGANPHLRAGAVVEPYRAEAFDLNVAVRSWPELALSAIERPVRKSGGDILGYQDKYAGGEGMASAHRELPAQLPDAVAERVREMAVTVAGVVGLRGVARIDFLAVGAGADQVYVNEINTIPGSLARYLWVDPQLAFRRLLDDLLDEAVRRPSFTWTTQGADGSALRAAGSIAGKLA